MDGIKGRVIKGVLLMSYSYIKIFWDKDYIESFVTVVTKIKVNLYRRIRYLNFHNKIIKK